MEQGVIDSPRGPQRGHLRGKGGREKEKEHWYGDEHVETCERKNCVPGKQQDIGEIDRSY